MIKIDDTANGEATDDGFGVPDFLKVANRKPMSQAAQAVLAKRLADATAKATANPSAAADAAARDAIEAERKAAQKAKANARVATKAADGSSARAAMPLTGKAAAEAIKGQRKLPVPPVRMNRSNGAAPRGVTSPASKKVDPTTTKLVADALASSTAKAKAAAKQETRDMRTKSSRTAKATTSKARNAVKGKTSQRATGPSGMVEKILKLASRPNGASREELNTLTDWKGAPWKWLFANPKKNGYCDRWSYKLTILEGKEGETRYRVQKKAAA